MQAITTNNCVNKRSCKHGGGPIYMSVSYASVVFAMESLDGPEWLSRWNYTELQGKKRESKSDVHKNTLGLWLAHMRPPCVFWTNCLWASARWDGRSEGHVCEPLLDSLCVICVLLMELKSLCVTLFSKASSLFTYRLNVSLCHLRTYHYMLLTNKTMH